MVIICQNYEICLIELPLKEVLLWIEMQIITYNLQLALQNSSPLGSVMTGVTHWYPFKDF